MLLRSRTAAMLAGFGLFLAVLGGYAGPRWPAVVSLLVTDGALAAAWIVSAALLGSCLVPLFLRPFQHGSRAAPPPDGSSEPPAPPSAISPVFRFVTCAALGLGLFSLTALGLGLLGWLNRATAAALPVVSVALGLFRRLRLARRAASALAGAPRPRGPRVEAWLRAPAGWHWLWVATAPLLAIVVLGDSLTPGLLWKPDDPHPYDVLEYHLQLPREWYEAGRIVPLHHNVFSFFPLNAEMHSLCAMHLRGGPWAGMYLAQYLCGFNMVLATLAIYGAARNATPRATATLTSPKPGQSAAPPRMFYGRPKSSGAALRSAPAWEASPKISASPSSPLPAILAALAFACVPWIPMLAATAYDESALLLYATLSIGWAARALCSPRGRARTMALAGAFAGLAAGVKYTAVPLVLLGVPACAFLAELIRAAFRRRDAADPPAPMRFFSACCLFAAAGLLFVSPWLARNLAWSGNPVFPLAMRLLGRGHFSELQVERFERAHAPPVNARPPAARLARAWHETAAHWEYGYALWIVVMLACIIAAAQRPRHATAGPPPADFFHRRLLFLAALLLLTFGVWVGFTHLISRFFILAVPAAALLIGSVEWHRLNPAAGLLAAALLVCGAFLGWLGAGSTGTRRLLADPMNWAQSGLFGLTDVSVLVADDLVPIETGPGRVALIGDAQPFLHPVPMARLSYRTVFDVDADLNTPPTGDLGFANAWLPKDQPGPRPGRTIIVYRNEVERLARTYRSPDLPPPMKQAQQAEEAAARREGRPPTDHVYFQW